MAEQRQPSVAQQQFAWETTSDVSRAMIGAGSSGKSRIKAGLKAAWKSKTGSMFSGADTTLVARALRIMGHQNAAKWYDRFFAKHKEKKGKDEDDDTSPKEKAESGLAKKQTAILMRLEAKIDTIGGSLDLVAEDVTDIKSLLSPKGVVANDKDGNQQFVQYNPLAPQNERFKQVTEKGKLTAKAPSKEFQQSAQKKVALETAKLALSIQEKDKQKGELRKKFAYKDKVEQYKKEDELEALKETTEEGFKSVNEKIDKLKDKGILGTIMGWFEDLMGLLRDPLKLLGMISPLAMLLGKGGLVGLAAWAGTAIGTWIYEKWGVKILDAVFAIKDWWENLDVLGMIRPLTDAIRTITDTLHITKSEEQLKREHAANAKEGRMPGGVASTKGPSYDQTIELMDKQAKTAKTPEAKAAAEHARDVLISQKTQRSAGAPVTATATVTTSAPTPAPTSPVAYVSREEGSDTIDTNYPQKPAVGGTGTIGKQSKDLLMPDANIKDTIISAAKRVGVDSGIMLAMAKQESGFNPNAKAKTSTAKGLYQFLNATWDDMVKKYGKTYPELKNGQMDPVASSLAGALFIKENGAILSKAGIPVDGTSIYAAHFLGPGGAKKLLSADPQTDAAALMPKPAAANKFIFFNKDGSPRTVSEVKNVLFEKVGKYAALYSDKLLKEDSGVMVASNNPSPVVAPAPATSKSSFSPAPAVPGEVLDKGSRELSAQNKQPAATTVVAPTNVSQTTVNNTTNKKPLPKADILNPDNSFVRTVGKDVVHPAYG
jgi:arginine repressor